MKLHKVARNLLNEVLELAPLMIGVNLLRFRADRLDKLDVIDRLVSDAHLPHYGGPSANVQISIFTLPQLRTPRARAHLADLEAIYTCLRREYRANLMASVDVDKIAREARLSKERAVECLTYMLQAYCLSNTADDLDRGYVVPNEQTLRHKTLREHVKAQICYAPSAESKRWTDDTSRAPTAVDQANQARQNEVAARVEELKRFLPKIEELRSSGDLPDWDSQVIHVTKDDFCAAFYACTKSSIKKVSGPTLAGDLKSLGYTFKQGTRRNKNNVLQALIRRRKLK